MSLGKCKLNNAIPLQLSEWWNSVMGQELWKCFSDRISFNFHNILVRILQIVINSNCSWENEGPQRRNELPKVIYFVLAWERAWAHLQVVYFSKCSQGTWMEGDKSNTRQISWIGHHSGQSTAQGFLPESFEELAGMFLRIACLKEKSDKFVMSSGFLWLQLLQGCVPMCEWHRFPHLSQASSALEKPWDRAREIIRAAEASTVTLQLKLVS